MSTQIAGDMARHKAPERRTTDPAIENVEPNSIEGLMISILAAIAVVTLFAIIAAPGLVVLYRGKRSAFVGPFYMAVLIALTFYHVGFPFWSGGTDARVRKQAQSLHATERRSEGTGRLCEQALNRSEQLGLILDRSNRASVVVRQELWEQLPEQARDGLLACLKASAPPGPVQIVERRGRQ